MSKKSSKKTSKHSNKPRRSTLRRGQVETLEAREVMSADPLGGLLGGAVSHHAIQDDAPVLTQHVGAELTQPGGFDYSHHADPNADFWLDEQPAVSLEEQLEQIEKSLSSAHQLTGMDHVKTDYGFSGIGQTVAVIDSGIAYDHYALGGGLGSNYRVVGGYDFTELDSNPYDDGTEGSHGTHVAGIVGADDGNRSGVAPGVDLVGLRVFADNGSGYFSWVESALQWVHDNRNAFENPITAINLSLGTSWNSSSIPAWAMLENEFAQLEADGIFISVSAGNSYTTYNTPGLSYPAASPYVVPVMSSDDSGFLSYFSQRHERAISAPGRYIYSTVPDYAGNNNGVTDDWANFSGTSMAAPYVAGASVIIREAMEFVGMTGITQDTIYDHMIATADSFYDSTSDAYYNRLNVQSAIDALMPEDDFGSSVETAYNLGTINAGLESNAGPMSGAIAKLDDADYFTFTAGATGTVSFSAQNTTHYLAAAWNGMGADGWTSDGGATYTLNVVAGQEYCVALSSGDGLGYYDLMVTAESTFTYTDWGATGIQETKSGLSISGETFYRLQAGRDGYVTAQALQTAGITGVDLLNSNLQVVATGAGGRVDYHALNGEELYLRVSGSATGVDFRLTNAVSVAGSVVTVLGTSGDDVISFAAGSEHLISMNGLQYQWDASLVDSLDLQGGGGSDSVSLLGSSGEESAVVRVGQAEMSGQWGAALATGFDSILVDGRGGADEATMYDSASNDTLVTWRLNAQLYGAGFSNSVKGIEGILAYGTGGGSDRAYIYDSTGSDTYSAYSDRSVMSGSGYSVEAAGFEATYAYASGSSDVANLYDSAGADLYSVTPDRATMSGSGYYNRATGFGATYGYASSGDDVAYLTGAGSGDIYVGWSGNGTLYGAGFSSRVSGFNRVDATSGGANSKAYYYDAAGNDVYDAYADRVAMSGQGYTNTARGFASSYAYSDYGDDVAYMRDSSGDDVYSADPTQVSMSGNGFYNRAKGFATTNAYASSGNDRATLVGSTGMDIYVGWSGNGILYGSGYYNRASGFDDVGSYGVGSGDLAYLYDTAGDDVYDAYSNRVQMSGAGYVNHSHGFSATYAYSSSGNDSANFYDSAGSDTFTGKSQWSSMAGAGYYNRASGFSTISGQATLGVDKAVLYDSIYDDYLQVDASGVNMQHASGLDLTVQGFDEVDAYLSDGDDTVSEQAVDYAFELIQIS